MAPKSIENSYMWVFDSSHKNLLEKNLLEFIGASAPKAVFALYSS